MKLTYSTGSNGDPNDPKSLHYIRGHKPTQYEQAIHAVGQILDTYDSDKQYPVWGFVRYHRLDSQLVRALN